MRRGKKREKMRDGIEKNKRPADTAGYKKHKSGEEKEKKGKKRGEGGKKLRGGKKRKKCGME